MHYRDFILFNMWDGWNFVACKLVSCTRFVFNSLDNCSILTIRCVLFCKVLVGWFHRLQSWRNLDFVPFRRQLIVCEKQILLQFTKFPWTIADSILFLPTISFRFARSLWTSKSRAKHDSTMDSRQFLLDQCGHEENKLGYRAPVGAEKLSWSRLPSDHVSLVGSP